METKQLFITKEYVFWSLALLLLIVFTYFIYLPGVNGSFIFDDIPNLSPLGKYKDFSLSDNFWLFLLEGDSGPTGRPVSLASFYLNDIAWPSQPMGFIKTNILIHLLNGVLAFWLIFLLCKSTNLSNSNQLLISFIATALWLLNPMQTTTVLYVIQRMTELSATFMLSGIIFYLYGREKLITSTFKGLSLLFIGVGSSLILAILSKENGILLVAYILVIEYFYLQPLKNKPPQKFYFWLIPGVILPFISLLIYLGIRTDPDSYAIRNFTLGERLLTEPRILIDYLKNILLPNMSNISLFHDDYEVSKNLISPWTTLPSIISILTLIISAFILRNKIPLLAFAIAWFFAGHLIESTVLPLELYFEHRNYLPILGMVFAIAWYASRYIDTHKIITLIIIICAITLNSFIVFQNSSLWGKPLEFGINLYKNHPSSERSKETYLLVSKLYGVPPTLVNHKNNFPNKNSLFYANSVVYDLSEACSKNEADKGMLNSTLSKLKGNTIHATVSKNMMNFLLNWQEGKCNKISSADIIGFLTKLSSLDNMKNNKTFLHDIFYSLSEIYRRLKDFNKTMINLDKAYSTYPNLEILKLKVGYLSSAELYTEALKALEDTTLLKKDIRAKVILKIKQKELDDVKDLIIKQMKSSS